MAAPYRPRKPHPRAGRAKAIADAQAMLNQQAAQISPYKPGRAPGQTPSPQTAADIQTEMAATARRLTPAKRRKATPIVTEHTRGQANAADRNVAPTPFQGRQGPVARPSEGASPQQIFKAADLVTMGALSGGVDLARHPQAHLFPQPKRDAQGALLPLEQQQVSAGVIPLGPIKRLADVFKPREATAAEAPATSRGTEPLFHGSIGDKFSLESAQPGLHVGTQKAALERLAYQRAPEGVNPWGPEFDLASEIAAGVKSGEKLHTLRFKPKVRILNATGEKMEATVERAMSDPQFRAELSKKYDAIKYTNLVEHKGSTSYYVLNPKALTKMGGSEQVRAALPGAKSVRGRQEAGYSAERSKRAATAAQIMRDNPGIEGHHAALASLRGELPKINYGGFKELTPEALDALAKHVHEHPNLLPFQKITAVRALENATEGRVPTRSEINLLTNIFGKDTTAGLEKIHTLPDHIKSVVIEALNVPRSLMASFDLSAPFRQGLMAGARHPVMFGRNFKPMLRSFGKEGAYRQVEQEIAERPTFHMMNAAKLAITDIEGDLTNREEQLFGYLMAEKIPVAGRVVRSSGRAYNAFLTKMRADMFDHLLEGFQKQGVNVHDEEFLKHLGRYINASTGRGDLGYFQGAAPYLNTVFFSPRLLASRLNFLNPVFYARLPAPIRQEALRSAIQLTGLVTTTLGLAAVGGAKVGLDPRNADFAKVRLGNTRLDVLGGFQQPVRLLSQLGSGKVISSTTGDPLTLGPGIGGLSRRDIVQRFFEGKLAPVPSVVNDWFKGTDFQGQPFSWKKETLQHMIPLLAQDAADLYNESPGGVRGVASAAAGYGVGAFGIGVQSYGKQPPRADAVVKRYEKKLATLGVTDPDPRITAAINAEAVRAQQRKQQPDTTHGRLKADLNALVRLKKITPATRAATLREAAPLSEYQLAQQLRKAHLSEFFDPDGVLSKIDDAVKQREG